MMRHHKKSGLNKVDIKYYRPFYLPFISKVIEKVGGRMDYFVEHNDLNDNHQSAYRRGHSTETALSKVHSDIAGVLDEGFIRTLVMLGLSAAFDVMDHPILGLILDNALGMEKQVNFKCTSCYNKIRNIGHK